MHGYIIHYIIIPTDWNLECLFHCVRVNAPPEKSPTRAGGNFFYPAPNAF